MNISHMLPHTVSIFLFTVVAVIHLISSRSIIKQLGAKEGSLIVFLRSLALVALVLFLLNPFYIQKIPNKNSFSIAVLADVSGSMKVKDEATGVSRINIVSSLLRTDSTENIINTFGDRFSFIFKAFSEKTENLNASSHLLPQENKFTAIGDAIQTIVAEQKNSLKPLAGIVLLTDGHNNIGSDLSQAIQSLKENKIPVTAIGIGELKEKDGLKVRFNKRKISTFLGNETELPVTATNYKKEILTARLDLFQNQKKMDSQILDIPGGEEINVSFSIVTEFVGSETYSVNISGIDKKGDLQKQLQISQDTTDKILVYSKRNDDRKVLYISDQLSPDYRFIKQSISGEESIELNTLIRLTDNIFYRQGDKLPEAFPEHSEFWQTYDVILLNTNVIPKLSAAVLEGLHDFVNKRGGGLLVFGALEAGNIEADQSSKTATKKQFVNLLPGKQSHLLSTSRDENIEIQWQILQAPVMDYSPLIPQGTSLQNLSEINFSARTVAWSKKSETPVLSVQNYGAGMSAYWSLPQSWRWSLASKASHEVFSKYWQHLISWLGSGALDRLSFPSEEDVYALEEPVILSVDVTQPNYSPASNALVEAIINSPDGESRVSLFPDSKIPGRYSGTYRGNTAGTHEVNYQAILDEGEVLQRQTLLDFEFSQAENTDTTFQPDALKELAYATKGVYYHYSEIEKDLDKINIATTTGLPQIEVKKYLIDSSLFLLACIILLGSEWILRRKWGLL